MNPKVNKCHSFESFYCLLKGWSVILTTSFYDMNQKILTKKVISKISVDSNFTYTSYAWLCAVALLHRLLCYIKSRRQDFMWKLLLFHTETISASFLWGNALLGGELQIDAKNSNFEISESTLYIISESMPLKILFYSIHTPTTWKKKW